MRWSGRRESENIDDRRQLGGSGKIALGGGLSGIIVLLLVWLMGGNPLELMNMMQEDQSGQTGVYESSAEEDSLKHFSAFVLASTEDVWTAIFKQMGKTYRKPTLVFFSGYVNSACGSASSSTGPFYCPGDEKLYVDLSFYDEMKRSLGGGGDFAFAYVIAHEVGHHVQKLLGTNEQYEKLRQKASEKEANALTVKLELQADFYAGVWAYHEKKLFDSLDDTDLYEAINTASAIGDDRLQKQAQGYVVPDSFTHGTSAQRQRWFKKGFDTGDIRQGDTFSMKNL
ncbi:MAG: neutral zinc metallopeptidase [Dysgonamonadaceae bacterium]|jgi:predicted metalloprotease|nr:neutral zinc metallopeptidase [Dysgonamonadaceae bacterium]